jgi:hypothetical protein
MILKGEVGEGDSIKLVPSNTKEGYTWEKVKD